jgi:hypothetical protein
MRGGDKTLADEENILSGWRDSKNRLLAELATDRERAPLTDIAKCNTALTLVSSDRIAAESRNSLEVVIRRILAQPIDRQCIATRPRNLEAGLLTANDMPHVVSVRSFDGHRCGGVPKRTIKIDSRLIALGYLDSFVGSGMIDIQAMS